MSIYKIHSDTLTRVVYVGEFFSVRTNKSAIIVNNTGNNYYTGYGIPGKNVVLEQRV